MFIENILMDEIKFFIFKTRVFFKFIQIYSCFLYHSGLFRAASKLKY